MSELPLRSTYDKSLLEKLKIGLINSAYDNVSKHHYWPDEQVEVEAKPDPETYREVMADYILRGDLRYQPEDESAYETPTSWIEEQFKPSTFPGMKSGGPGFRFTVFVYSLLTVPFVYFVAVAFAERLFELTTPIETTLGLASTPTIEDLFGMSIGMLLFATLLIVSFFRFVSWFVKRAHMVILYFARFYAEVPARIFVFMIKLAYNQVVRLRIRLASYEYKRQWDAFNDSVDMHAQPE